jgi:circadian clock protein KaiB
MSTPAKNEQYRFDLFVADNSLVSHKAMRNINAILEERIRGSYRLDIVDIYEQPERTLAEQVITIPTLIRKSPLPEVRITGDLSETEEVIDVLML